MHNFNSAEISHFLLLTHRLLYKNKHKYLKINFKAAVELTLLANDL